MLCGILILQPILLGGVTAIAADKPVPSAKTISVWVTAYSSAPEETDSTPFVTASNKTVRDGIIATNILPFGTKVQIPKLFGEKIFIVEDRMSRRKTNFVDVWMHSKVDALEFGIHKAEVLIVASNSENKNKNSAD